MKKTIWKFGIALNKRFTIEMPEGAEILTVQSQYSNGFMWAICDPQAKMIERTFCVVGTGHSFDPNGKKYIGTYIVDDGGLVWHLFEII